MPRIVPIPANDFLRPGQAGLPDLGPYKYRFLGQGDSWFSLGAVPPQFTTSIPLSLNLNAKACMVNCAHPGFTLQRMETSVQDPDFTNLLMGNQRWAWDGILMSAGGNDLIVAVRVMANYDTNDKNNGKPIPPDKRILLRSDEWKPGTGGDRYISDTGWDTFSMHMKRLFNHLLQMRDDANSLSKNVPVFVHCYDFLQPRDAPTGSRLAKVGPWLLPAVKAYTIPPSDWQAVGTALINRLKALLLNIAQTFPNLRVVDTTNSLIAATPGSSGTSGDWVNEIHPTSDGYLKLSAKYAAEVNKVFS